MNDLFEQAGINLQGADGSDSAFAGSNGDQGNQPDSGVIRPLAVRMRPRTLDEVVGQHAALAAGSPLRRLAMPAAKSAMAAPSSVILFGPPGVGKTTLATIVSEQSGRAFEELSAVSSGVKDVRAVLDRARRRLRRTGQETILFIDEVHRFSKSQQDALLPAVENRDVTFVAATTENPSFSVISPLLSRSVVVKLEALSAGDIRTIVTRAISDPRGFDGAYELAPEALEQIVRVAGGDGRKALTVLEAAAGAIDAEENVGEKTAAGDASSGASSSTPQRITLAHVDSVMEAALVRYDKTGDEHYDVASAFIKSMRGSDPDAAEHYLARMIRAGEDPRFIARRIMIAAAEEVGMAAPQVLQTTVAAAQAVEMVGMPEARIILSEAVLAVATAPKSNASYKAINAALADVDKGNIGSVPLYLRNAPTKLMKQWGNHEGYKYAHDYPGEIVAQEYMPEPLRGHEYYHPSTRGYEATISRELPQIRRILHGEVANGSNSDENSSDRSAEQSKPNDKPHGKPPQSRPNESRKSNVSGQSNVRPEDGVDDE